MKFKVLDQHILKIDNLISIYLKSIKGPASKLKPTSLFIKGEVSDINITRGFKYCWRFPLDKTIVVESSFGHGSYVVVTISTVKENFFNQIRKSNSFSDKRRPPVFLIKLKFNSTLSHIIDD